MPELLIENWYGMVGPAGLPREILDKINRVAVEAMSDRNVNDKLADQGLTLVPQTPEEFRTFIVAEAAKWSNVVKKAGLETTK
jgi:tripartite-type tricarboxylate transporter receptor subunit TctC